MTFCAGRWPWFELIVPDVDKGVAFYAAVLGWEKAEMNMGDFNYTMLGPKGGRQGCGVVPPQGEGIPPHWTGYVTVPNVDEAGERAISAGGAVTVPAMDVPTVGRMAMVTDPQGAVFWLFTPEPQEGGDDEGDYAPGFHWAELHAKDPASAVPFYQHTLGVGHDTMDMGPELYHLLVAGGHGTCGITRQMHEGAPPMWLYWAVVEDADAALARATEQGGQVLMGAFDVPDIGRMGVLQDNQGAVLGVIKPAPRMG